MVVNCLAGEKLRVYSKGDNVRDWFDVRIHVRALHRVFEVGWPDEAYMVGSSSERTV